MRSLFFYLTEFQESSLFIPQNPMSRYILILGIKNQGFVKLIIEREGRGWLLVTFFPLSVP